MSSFLQKSQSDQVFQFADEREKIILPCPECGQISMKLIQSDCRLMDDTFIPNLEYYYCSSCHAKFYDDAAMGKIEQLRETRR